MASSGVRSRARFWRMVLIVGGLLVGLVFAELVARLVGPPLPGFVLDATLTAYEPRLYVRHPTRITTLAPGVDVAMEAIEYRTRVRTDRLGLRGAPAAGGELRIAFLGDSFTLGVQVEEGETFAERLAARVRTATGREVVALNAGVDGYGVRQSVDRLEELLRTTRISHAVLTVYTGNDLRDDTRLEEKRAAMNQPPPPEQEALLDPLPVMRRKSAWARHSRLYAWVQVVQAMRARSTDFRLQEYADELAVFVDPATRTTQATATRAALQRFARLCSARQLQCSVAFAPPAWAVHGERKGPTFEAFGLDAASASAESVVSELVAQLPAGLPVVDLLPPLRSAGDASALYFTFDPHWNAAGHEVVADALATAVQW